MLVFQRAELRKAIHEEKEANIFTYNNYHLKGELI